MTHPHTPGPWAPVPPVDNGSEFWEIEDGCGRTATVYGQPNDPETVATASLIAAAPAMLRALQRLTHPAADDEDLRDALDVIARATGQPVPDEETLPFWRCPDCGREYDDIDEGPCPADDCPSRDNVEDEGPEPPYAGYESEAELRRMAEVRALRAARGEA